MVKSLATLLFIAGVGSGAVYLALRPTVAEGTVIAAEMTEHLVGKGITAMRCDSDIPIGMDGATFQCVAVADDGSTAQIQYTMNREGGLSAEVIDTTGPTQPRIPTSGDPWGN